MTIYNDVKNGYHHEDYQRGKMMSDRLTEEIKKRKENDFKSQH